MVEKAFAKVHLRYDCLDLGYQQTGLWAITGAPVMVYDTEKTPGLFEMFLEAEQNNWIMTT